ncbi:hypothetical protein MIND_00575000 [Mycena indigotica]|uniref:Uncharacterized protein n=1 Tax=Mycena indigotica TaxID=2126181 RepID=A0A8H6SS97_9AGAR|nr:uncharacterized protein MIND_00575000 [Mycena indigotica]KAF7303462.1 hypothetical protein MIND_00575000 [Mycena indigotica]
MDTRILHNRDVWASIRVLYRAGVPKATLLDDFGGSTSTMKRIIRNDYRSGKDDEREDWAIAEEAALPKFKAAWQRLSLAQKAHVKREPQQVVVPADGLSGPRRGARRLPIDIRTPSPDPLGREASVPPPGQQPVIGDPDAHPNFLSNFLRQIGQPELYEPLKGMNVGREDLYRLAAADEELRDAFMEKLAGDIPGFSAWKRIWFTEKVKRLLIEVDDT